VPLRAKLEWETLQRTYIFADHSVIVLPESLSTVSGGVHKMFLLYKLGTKHWAVLHLV